jgi:hypothetical protein
MIGRLQSDADDTILWFSHTHGAHNPDSQADDPSRGHYLNMADGDVLYRKELLRMLQSKAKRLLVVATEACNRAEKPPRDIGMHMEQRVMTIQGLTPIAKLLQYHEGLIDLNAARAGQFSYNSDGTKFGLQHPIGVFSFFFTQGIQGNEDWDKVLSTVDSNAKEFVQQFYQETQDMAIFQKSVVRTAITAASPDEQQREQSSIIFVYEESEKQE